MLWYHGSKQPHTTLKRRKAIAPAGRPVEESLEAIYFTPDFAFAIACAVRPAGLTEIDNDKRTIRFGNLQGFEPQRNVYIHVVDSTSIPQDKITWADQVQVAVDMDEIRPERVEVYESQEVFKYYRLLE